MMAMPTRIYATQLCLLQVPLFAVYFYFALQPCNVLLWCKPSTFLVVDPDFFRLLCDSVTPSIVNILVSHVHWFNCELLGDCRFLIFWTSDSSCCSILRTVLFFILSPLVISNNLLNRAISALSIFRSSSFFKHQHFYPYSSTDATKVLHNLTLVLFEMLRDFHILLSLFMSDVTTSK